MCFLWATGAHRPGTSHVWRSSEMLLVSLIEKKKHPIKAIIILSCLIMQTCALTEFYLLSSWRRQGGKTHRRGLTCSPSRWGTGTSAYRCAETRGLHTSPPGLPVVRASLGCYCSCQRGGPSWCSPFFPSGVAYSDPLGRVLTPGVSLQCSGLPHLCQVSHPRRAERSPCLATQGGSRSLSRSSLLSSSQVPVVL